MSVNAPRFLAEYKDIYSGYLDRTRSLIVDGYWHLRDNRRAFKLKGEDFSHIQNASEGVLEALEILISQAEGNRDKPGVQVYINEVLSTINIHLDRISKYYPKNNPKGFKTKEDQRDEGKFQLQVFKGEQKIRAKIRDLNIENNMDNLEIKFFDNVLATLPMKEMLCNRSSKIAAKCESLDIDWDLIMDNGMFINMKKRDIPDYNEEKHFWDQEIPALQFYVSEFNKIKKGLNIDGYEMTPWMYFHLNYFKTPIKNQGNKIMNPPLRDNEWYLDEIKKYAKKKAEELESAASMIYGSRRWSKALRDDEPLYYEDGERPIGDAKIGDKIYGADGKLTNIVGVYPQGKVDLYKVSFGDGRDVISCDEHLWYVYDYQAKIYKTLPLKEIMNGGYSYERKRKWGDADRISTIYKYWIPLTQPIEYQTQSLNIDPYYLGLWLGDGHSDSTRITSMDQEIIDYIESYSKEIGMNCRVSSTPSKAFDIGLSTDPNKTNPLLNTLREYGVIQNKHIPEIFFKSSVEQRLELLRGIMDTDGTIGVGGGGIKITLASQILSQNILKLCRTLGINSQITKGTGTYIKKNGELNTFWTVTMFTDLPIFKLKRKLKRIDVTPNPSRENKKYRVPITNIDYVENNNATCIRVDNKDKLFLTRDCVVTHNTTGESSHTHHGILIYTAETGTITSTTEKDLNSMVDKIKKSLDNIHPAFKLNIMSGKGFDKEVLFGLKSGSGRISYEHFNLGITNTDGGSKKGGQKTAGGNPIVYVADEIGKDSFLKAHRAAVPSFEADNGWACLPIYSGTAGEEDLSKDAETVLRNPKANDFIEMDWDILEYGIPKEHISWNRRRFGWFLPAQMAIKTGHRKIKTNLADFLKIDSEELSKVTMNVTDWEHNLKVIKERRKSMTGEDLQQEIVFRPIDPEECFMSAKKNPYPAQGIKRHKERLQNEGDEVYGLAKKIDLYRDPENRNIIKHELSKKDVNVYPHDGSFTDHAALLYDDFPDTRPSDPYRFVAGFDDVKQDESSGDSIPSFMIFDRLKRKIVFSLANRTDPKIELYKYMHMALDAWNAKCFMENEDMDFKKYLDRVSDPSLYLYKGFDAYDDFSKFQNGKRKFGWRPDKNTVPIIRGYTLDYVKDNQDEEDKDGNVTHTVSGYERIEDIQLLEEMIKYKPDGNFDRLVSFGSCLAIDYYLTSKYITPHSATQRTNEDRKQQFKRPRNKFFTGKSRSPFSR